MPASIEWDHVKAADLQDDLNGITLDRGLKVKGLDPVIASGATTDPSLLLRCYGVSGFPAMGSFWPDTSIGTLASWLQVKRRRFLGVEQRAPYTLAWAITYQGLVGGLDPIWTVHEDYTVSWLQTAATAGGQNAIGVWYKKDEDGKPLHETPDDMGPIGSDLKMSKCHVMRSNRMIRAIANMPTSQWQTAMPGLRSIAGTINSSSWKTGTRGQWYFVGPRTVTTNFGSMTQASLEFLFSPYGHYGLVAYYNRFGEHPDDCDTEAWVTGSYAPSGLPAVGGVVQGNGLTWASVQYETDFNSVFTGLMNFSYS